MATITRRVVWMPRTPGRRAVSGGGSGISASPRLEEPDGEEATVARLEGHPAQRPELARRTRDALAGGDVEATVVAVTAQVLDVAGAARRVRDGTGEVRAPLLE